VSITFHCCFLCLSIRVKHFLQKVDDKHFQVSDYIYIYIYILVIEGINVVFPICTAFSGIKFKMYQHSLLQHIIFLKPFSQSKSLFMYLIIFAPNKGWTFNSQGHTVAQI